MTTARQVEPADAITGHHRKRANPSRFPTERIQHQVLVETDRYPTPPLPSRSRHATAAAAISVRGTIIAQGHNAVGVQARRVTFPAAHLLSSSRSRRPQPFQAHPGVPAHMTHHTRPKPEAPPPATHLTTDTSPAKNPGALRGTTTRKPRRPLTGTTIRPRPRRIAGHAAHAYIYMHQVG